MGLATSFASLGRIIGPLWAGFIYDVDLTFPFISGAAVLLVSFAISLIWVGQEREVPGRAYP